MRIATLCALVLVASLPACTHGSGVQANEERTVEAFEAIDVGGPFQVSVELGSQVHVEVGGDDNVVPKVRTVVEGKTLHVELPGSVSLELPLTLRVTAPSLLELELGGAATADVGGIEGERFEVDLGGASTATLRGRVQSFEADVSGASTLRAAELAAEAVEVDASGASKAEVSAAEALKANASGASTIRYHGQPGELSRDASGASTIEAAG
ncbi:head GIN domain-containing protein [Paraliomyxa miuraensis]|uniref:head GIN domain-containing protein n=1 Tax=Paraliomyxa miuraensis TaxID=376150 RepID=UPI00225BF971|nr:head GIN domain-containing protein [Paraliomyxa miuraensis]MCX4244979.1 DUF2807 domain-containing protein [Paraliomyxa miuraensis]